MSNISIFAKRAFLNVNSGQEFEYTGQAPKKGHLLRVSSIIRADQIAEHLGAKLNPTEGYENDVCIYVKPHVPKGVVEFNFEGNPYMDIIDGWGLLPLMSKYPHVPVIACSRQDKEILSKILDNKIIFIPQHHCNFERVKRNREGIKTIGIIGTSGAFDFLPFGLKEILRNRGIELLEYSKFFTRQDIVDFYKKIDLQIVWRPYRMRLSNPLKIVNASSFGIPTIAYEESVFEEMEGCYIPVRDLDELVRELDTLIAYPVLYEHIAQNCLSLSEIYHIDRIAERYKELK